MKPVSTQSTGGSGNPCAFPAPRSRPALDRLGETDLPGRRIALLSHYAAVDSSFRSAAEVVASSGRLELRCILGPQHGFWGETQDNMIEWSGYLHPVLGVPVHSLYGESREPTPDMLDGADCLLVDLQDVGSRYYTYAYAMAYALRLAARLGMPAVVLDRPNPAGLSIVEGSPQQEGFLSYVGLYPIPARHAMTIGELARLFCAMDGNPPPSVEEAEIDDPAGYPDDMPWVAPSPNMPTPGTALVYPGMCLLEGTNLSEGRGTCRPFEVFGAPWINPERLCGALAGSPFLEGAALRPHRFVPTFGKHAGLLCGGAQIHVTDRSSFRALRAASGILSECFRQGCTAWRQPPYEYVYDRMPIDILTGSPALREAVEAHDDALLLGLASPPSGHPGAEAGALVYERSFVS